jgi:hypothetical protein
MSMMLFIALSSVFHYYIHERIRVDTYIPAFIPPRYSLHTYLYVVKEAQSATDNLCHLSPARTTISPSQTSPSPALSFSTASRNARV